MKRHFPNLIRSALRAQAQILPGVGYSRASSFPLRVRVRFLSKDSSADTAESKEWMRPSRPLSGDKGNIDSHLYTIVDEKGRKVVITTDSEEEDTDIDAEIQKIISQDTEANENVQFIDLEDMDMEDFQKRVESGEFGDKENEDITEEDVDLDELIKSMQEMDMEMDKDEDYEEYVEGKDDQDQGQGQGQEKEDDSGEKEDVFQKHFEANDFLQSQKVPDWLSTRRAKMSKMMSPSDARKKRNQASTGIPVIQHTLLSADEIISSLTANGAQDVKLIIPEDELKSYFGWKGMIIATASSYSLIRILTDNIVKSLRKRGLAERGVIGAQLGSEGGENTTISSRARKKRMLGGKKIDDGWMSVDCRNYIVHVQDELTRRNLNLEALWTPGSEEGKHLRRLDPKDEDAVDDYVANNPIPDEYTESMVKTNDFWSADGRNRGGYLREKNNRSISGRYQPTNNKKRKVKNRGRYSL